jgi:hypothetical protein
MSGSDLGANSIAERPMRGRLREHVWTGLLLAVPVPSDSVGGLHPEARWVNRLFADIVSVLSNQIRKERNGDA